MDKAPAYGAGDSRFDPWHVHFVLIYPFLLVLKKNDDLFDIGQEERNQRYFVQEIEMFSYHEEKMLT
jgi:hypothetical protein